jgi:WD40 repeat protein
MDRKLETGVVVTSLAYSASGDAILGVCRDGKLRHWDAASGAVRKTIAWDEGDTSPYLTPAGLVTVGKDGSLKTWDLQSGKVIRRLSPPGPRSRRIAVSPDGRLFAGNIRMKDSDAETHVRVWDAGGREIHTLPAGLGGVGAFVLSPDGFTIVAASYDADIRAWSSRSGELLKRVEELPVSMFDAKFSPDGKLLAAAGADRIIYLFDTASWGLTRRISGLPEMVSALAFSPDGRRLASGGFSELTLRNPVKVTVWSLASGQPVRTVDAPHRVTSLAFSPNGNSLAVAAGESFLQVWQIPA